MTVVTNLSKFTEYLFRICYSQRTNKSVDIVNAISDRKLKLKGKVKEKKKINKKSFIHHIPLQNSLKKVPQSDISNKTFLNNTKYNDKNEIFSATETFTNNSNIILQKNHFIEIFILRYLF